MVDEIKQAQAKFLNYSPNLIEYIFRNKLPCSVTYFKFLLFKHYKEKWSKEIRMKKMPLMQFQ